MPHRVRVRHCAAACVDHDHRGPATYRIGPDGRLRRASAPPSPYPRAAIWFPGTGTWYMLRHHHLVVGRGHQAVWRSDLRVPSRWRLGVIAAGAHGVAFQFEHKLYIAPIGGVERPVAQRELPLGWTPAGLYTYSYRARALLLRNGVGRRLRVTARQPLAGYFVADGRLYFMKPGELMGVDGTRVERLASLQRLGLSSNSWAQPLGRFLELQDDHHLVVLRKDGSVFASTRLPPGREAGVDLVGFPAVAPRAGLLALATVTDQTAHRTVETETVYLLRSGAHEAIPVHTETGAFGGCERWANLQWHGKWLLYSSTQGNLAVIDSSRRHRTIELTGFARRLPGISDGLGAYWTRQPPS